MLPKAPSFRLDGRRALVTGAGRGIGLAAAAALSEAGAGVTLCARTASEIDAAAEAIRANGGTAGVLVLDVTDVMAASAAIGAAEPFDILVNNAGTNRPKHVSAVSVADFDFVMNLNVRAAYFVAQAVSRRLIQADVGGSIINISSQMGHVGAEDRSVYCASKWAMEGFSKAMALDLARYGIRVNTIAPTFIDTPLTKPFFKDQVFKDQVMSKIKLGRLGQVEGFDGSHRLPCERRVEPYNGVFDAYRRWVDRGLKRLRTPQIVLSHLRDGRRRPRTRAFFALDPATAKLSGNGQRSNVAYEKHESDKSQLFIRTSKSSLYEKSTAEQSALKKLTDDIWQ